MTVETFALPDVGEGVAEGELLRWLVEPGEEVQEDQPLAEVETDKAVVDLPSPYEGRVVELHAEAGETVPVGSVVVSVETGGGEDVTDGTGTSPDPDPDPEGGSGEAGSTADRRAVAPPRTRRLARELGVDIDRVSGSGPGGRVTDADVREAAEGRDDATARRESAATGERAAAAVDGAGPSRDRTLAAPATRRLANELGVDLNAVPIDERREGVAFVTPERVREYAAGRDDGTTREEAADGSDDGDGTPTTPAADPSPGDRLPYRGIRRTIGERLVESADRVPHVTHTDEADVTRLVETKAELEPYAAAEGVSLTYLPFVLRAVARALAEFPRVNASLDETEGRIRCHDAYNIGVATATEAGLLVPVVEDVDEKGLLDIAAETATTVERARDRRIDREEMQGGTFTVTNVGTIGGRYATPIVNHPEVAILALGRIEERPWVVDGEVVARHTLPLSLSVDHRVVDGAVAARFTNRVMDLLAAPARLLVD